VCIGLLSILIVSLVMFSGFWGRHTSTPRILMAKDRSELATLKGARLQGSYDPYFNRVNFTRGIMPPPANSLRTGSKPHCSSYAGN